MPNEPHRSELIFILIRRVIKQGLPCVVGTIIGHILQPSIGVFLLLNILVLTLALTLILILVLFILLSLLLLIFTVPLVLFLCYRASPLCHFLFL